MHMFRSNINLLHILYCSYRCCFYRRMMLVYRHKGFYWLCQKYQNSCLMFRILGDVTKSISLQIVLFFSANMHERIRNIYVFISLPCKMRKQSLNMMSIYGLPCRTRFLLYASLSFYINKMTSCHEKAFCITGTLWGESIGHRRFYHTKA